MTQRYGPTSDAGYYTRHDASNEHFSDAPVSVDYARMMRENTLHMFDESTQMVANLCAPSSTHEVSAGSGGWRIVTSVPVPITFRLDGAPATLVYRVGVGDSDLDVQLDVVNWNAPFVRSQEEAFISASGSNTFGSGSVWAISGFKSFEVAADDTRRARATRKDSEQIFASYNDAGKTEPANVVTHWWRADVWMDDEEDDRILSGLMIRQFMPIAESA